jgi:hypothetical protein
MALARAKSGHWRAMGQVMGDLILLSPRRQSGAARRRDGESAEAQIMFFTGVRYQRMSEPATTETNGGRPTSAGGKRKRKRG